MKSYAVFQAFRYLFLAATTAVLAGLSVDGDRLPIVFTISEALLFILVFPYSLRHVRLEFSGLQRAWLGEHVRYGSKASIGNLFLEINTKTDILVLGLFAPSWIVGIYSLPATLVEAFNQIAIVFRTNVNPLLTARLYRDGHEQLGALIKSGTGLSYKLLIPIGLLAVAAFPPALALFSLRGDFGPGLVPFR